jgi:sirohydrochlorin cobaltochelatase
MGMHPQLFGLVRDREIETQLGQVNMNCELCKFRLAALNGKPAQPHSHGHDHPHPHSHDHDHGHHHSGPNLDDEAAYHDRIWQVP